MKFLELAAKRESVRKFSSKPVPHESLLRCLEAARMAPSACNSQAWHFYVVTDREKREKLCRTSLCGIYSMNSFCSEAPVIVAVARTPSRVPAAIAGKIRHIDYNLIDLGIAAEHFVLQAAEEKLGTCWIGWFDRKNVIETLGLNSRTAIDVLIAVGYPDYEGFRTKERKKLEEISTFI